MTRGQRAAGVAFLLALALGWNLANVAAVAEQTAHAYGSSLATVGLFTTVTFVVHAAFQLPAGRIIDWAGPQASSAAAGAVIALASALALPAPWPWLALLARALLGFGFALGFVGGVVYLREHSGSALALGLYGGLALGTGGLALAIVPQLEGPLGWRAPFWSALAWGALAAFALLAGPRDAPRAVRRRERKEASRPAAGSVLRDGRLYRLALVHGVSFGFSVVLGNWVVTLLVRAGGYSEKLAGAVGSLVLLGAVVSRPLGGWLLRARPAQVPTAVAVSFAVSCVGTVLLTIAGVPALSVAGGLMLGLAAGIPFAAVFAASSRLRPEAPGSAASLVNMAANLVIVAGTPLAGLAFSLPGDGRIAFAAAAALWLAALPLAPRLPGLTPALSPAGGDGSPLPLPRQGD